MLRKPKTTIFHANTELWGKVAELLRKFEDDTALYREEKIVVEWRKEIDNLLLQITRGMLVSANCM